METVKVADCPALIVSLPGLRETPKSGVLPTGAEMDCKACTKSKRPLPIPAPRGTAWATAAAALDSLVVVSAFNKRAPAPETNGALKDVPHPAA